MSEGPVQVKDIEKSHCSFRAYTKHAHWRQQTQELTPHTSRKYHIQGPRMAFLWLYYSQWQTYPVPSRQGDFRGLAPQTMLQHPPIETWNTIISRYFVNFWSVKPPRANPTPPQKRKAPLLKAGDGSVPTTAQTPNCRRYGWLATHQVVAATS